jgi:hypothetical protein
MSTPNNSLTLDKLTATLDGFNRQVNNPFLRSFAGMPLVVDDDLKQDYVVHVSPAFYSRILRALERKDEEVPR